MRIRNVVSASLAGLGGVACWVGLGALVSFEEAPLAEPPVTVHVTPAPAATPVVAPGPQSATRETVDRGPDPATIVAALDGETGPLTTAAASVVEAPAPSAGRVEFEAPQPVAEFVAPGEIESIQPLLLEILESGAD